jgi:hypothetical protein
LVLEPFLQLWQLFARRFGKKLEPALASAEPQPREGAAAQVVNG